MKVSNYSGFPLSSNLEKRGSRKILAGSRNLGSVFDKSRSLVFSWFVFTFFESRNFSPKSLGLGFLTRISASRRVSDFTIRHPSCCYANSRQFYRDRKKYFLRLLLAIFEPYFFSFVFVIMASTFSHDFF